MSAEPSTAPPLPLEEALRKHDNRLTIRSVVVAAATVLTGMATTIIFIDNRVAAQTDAGMRVQAAEQKAVDEATTYMQSELAAIESDTTLNPNGDKVDPNKLLKFTLDNDLVDSKGRWNYRAAFRLMNAGKTETKTVNKDRKDIAGATTSEGKAETKASPVKTSADFKKDRPW